MPHVSPRTPAWAARPALFLVGVLFVPLGGSLVLDGHGFGFVFAAMGLLFLVTWWFLQPEQPTARARRRQRWACSLSLVTAALVVTAAVLFLGTGAHRPTFAELAPSIGVGVLAVAALVARVVVGVNGRRS
ncbi:hypothetical protein [Amycolatopsis thermoflava]|uniref:Uncharacterized protein n=1 Tax=Amycolatopsis thermoflava TaxID=84480 RepID=A0A3N2H134_9PSEU|nr:hypothetical protein [Amycolatopsis thermoflava]ROS42623.1 hypothetical protein EDD35_5015 [Amycolatopsis thermoflava]